MRQKHYLDPQMSYILQAIELQSHARRSEGIDLTTSDALMAIKMSSDDFFTNQLDDDIIDILKALHSLKGKTNE